MPTLAQLKKAAIFAKQNGDDERALKFHSAVQYETERRNKDPSYSAEGSQMVNPDVPRYVSDDVPWIKPAEPEEGILSKAADVVGGIAEVPVTVATGLAGQAVGLGNMIHEGVKAYFAGANEGRGVAAVDEYLRSDSGRRADEAFSAGAEAVTYQPRTDTGQAILETAGDALKPLPPVLGPSLAQAGIAGQAVRGAAPIARARVIDPGVQMAKQGAQKAVDVSKDVVSDVSRRTTEAFNRPKMFKDGQGPIAKSVGAAGTDDAIRRTETARRVGAHLTKARASGRDDLIKWENEMAHDFERGEELRMLAKENNRAISSTFDEMMEETGYQYGGDYERGEAFSTELWNQYAKERQLKNEAYDRAKEAGHMDDPIRLTALADVINENLSGAKNTVLEKAVAEGVEKGIFDLEEIEIRPGVTANRVVARPTPINATEELSQYISRMTKEADNTDRYFRDNMKRAINENQEGQGGPLYTEARDLNTKLMDDYINDKLVKDLLMDPGSRKNRKIAIEQVMDSIILSPRASLDRVEHIMGLLNRSDGGAQVIREIQAATLDKIQQATYANATWTGLSEDAKASYARINKQLNNLDKTRKLEVLVGSANAQRVRDIRDTIKWLNVQPEGTFNNSRTAYEVKGMLSRMIKSKVPFMDLVDTVKAGIEDRKTRAKLIDNLRGFADQEAPVQRQPSRPSTPPEPPPRSTPPPRPSPEPTRPPKKINLSDGLVRYQVDGGVIDILESGKYADGPTVYNFVVDEGKRGQGVGTKLLEHVENKYNKLSGQVSSMASLKVFYNRGFRAEGMESASFKDHVKKYEEAFSLFMIKQGDQ